MHASYKSPLYPRFGLPIEAEIEHRPCNALFEFNGTESGQLQFPSHKHEPYLLSPLPATQPLLVDNAVGTYSTQH